MSEGERRAGKNKKIESGHVLYDVIATIGNEISTCSQEDPFPDEFISATIDNGSFVGAYILGMISIPRSCRYLKYPTDILHYPIITI